MKAVGKEKWILSLFLQNLSAETREIIMLNCDWGYPVQPRDVTNSQVRFCGRRQMKVNLLEEVKITFYKIKNYVGSHKGITHFTLLSAPEVVIYMCAFQIWTSDRCMFSS